VKLTNFSFLFGIFSISKKLKQETWSSSIQHKSIKEHWDGENFEIFHAQIVESFRKSPNHMIASQFSENSRFAIWKENKTHADPCELTILLIMWDFRKLWYKVGFEQSDKNI
jgi:hypothetical protein